MTNLKAPSKVFTGWVIALINHVLHFYFDHLRIITVVKIFGVIALFIIIIYFFFFCKYNHVTALSDNEFCVTFSKGEHNQTKRNCFWTLTVIN